MKPKWRKFAKSDHTDYSNNISSSQRRDDDDPVSRIPLMDKRQFFGEQKIRRCISASADVYVKWQSTFAFSDDLPKARSD